MTRTAVHPVDEKLPLPRLTALGLQHVLVMYAGAIAVPLIVGRALKLSPEHVALLISADLFACGIVTLIQSLGMTKYFGIKLPVMMGVTFAAVGPMVAIANAMPGEDGARAIFGAIIGAGIVCDADRAGGQQDAALLPAGGDRHDHHDHRRQPDARRRRLGDGWAGLPGAAHRRPETGRDGRQSQGGPPPGRIGRGFRHQARADPDDRQPELRRSRPHGDRRLRARHRAAARQVREGLHRQHLGAAWHHRRLHPGLRHGPDELRQGRPGGLVRHRHPARVRHADLRLGDDPDDVARDDRRHDRIDRHVPRPVGHHRQEDRASRNWRQACAPTAWAR